MDVLIHAFLDRKNKDYHLVIAGNYHNSYGDFLRNLAKEDDHIHFIGIVMGEDKETLLKNCFVNCLVSSNEGMPISLLEAMVYAKPCIVTDIPAIREVLENQWGYWCKVGDYEDIKEQMAIIEDEYDNALDKAKEMANYVRNNHLWDNIAIKYCKYISEL